MGLVASHLDTKNTKTLSDTHYLAPSLNYPVMKQINVTGGGCGHCAAAGESLPCLSRSRPVDNDVGAETAGDDHWPGRGVIMQARIQWRGVTGGENGEGRGACGWVAVAIYGMRLSHPALAKRGAGASEGESGVRYGRNLGQKRGYHQKEQIIELGGGRGVEGRGGGGRLPG